MKRAFKYTYLDRTTVDHEFKYTKSGDRYAVMRNGEHRLLTKGNQKPAYTFDN